MNQTIAPHLVQLEHKNYEMFVPYLFLHVYTEQFSQLTDSV